MKKKSAVVLMCLFLTLANCSSCYHVQKASGFFAWMDGYVAVAEKTRFTFALTYFYESKDAPIKMENVIGLAFENISNNVKIDSYSIEKNSGNDGDKYSAYGVTVVCSASSIGSFETDHLIIQFADNSQLSYPIGAWVFDIGAGEPDTEYVDTWGSPAASQVGNVFPYIYVTESDVKISKIWVGKDTVISNEDGLDLSGNIKLESSAPISYIKSKIEISRNGEKHIFYAKGCYCGAYGIDESVLDLFSEYTDKNK